MRLTTFPVKQKLHQNMIVSTSSPRNAQTESLPILSTKTLQRFFPCISTRFWLIPDQGVLPRSKVDSIRRRSLLFAFFLLLFAGLSVLAEGETDALKKALLFGKNRHYDQAIPILREILSKEPRHERAWYFLVLSLHRLGQRSEIPNLLMTLQSINFRLADQLSREIQSVFASGTEAITRNPPAPPPESVTPPPASPQTEANPAAEKSLPSVLSLLFSRMMIPTISPIQNWRECRLVKPYSSKIGGPIRSYSTAPACSARTEVCRKGWSASS